MPLVQTSWMVRAPRRPGPSLRGYVQLGDDGDGFSWSDFGTSIAKSAAAGAAAAGVQRLTAAVRGSGSAGQVQQQPAPVASGVPSWVWIAGGGALLLLVVVLVAKR